MDNERRIPVDMSSWSPEHQALIEQSIEALKMALECRMMIDDDPAKLESAAFVMAMDPDELWEFLQGHEPFIPHMDKLRLIKEQLTS